MAGQPRPDGGSPLDKLSKDVSQYRQKQVATKQVRRRAVVRVARPQAGEGPGWTELDSNLSSQIVVWLLIAGYAILMLASCIALFSISPLGSSVLWPIMSIGIIVAMIAHQKGRAPLLWFMYGSVLPMVPLMHAVLGNWIFARSLGGQAEGGPADLMAVLVGGKQALSSLGDFFMYGCVLGALPVVHVLLVSPDQAVQEARQIASGMKKCPSCAELIKRCAKVCRYCGAAAEGQSVRERQGEKQQ